VSLIVESIMIELTLIAAAHFPHVFANEYCLNRHFGMDHNAATVDAISHAGEPTEESWTIVKSNQTWCPVEAEYPWTK